VHFPESPDYIILDEHQEEEQAAVQVPAQPPAQLNPIPQQREPEIIIINDSPPVQQPFPELTPEMMELINATRRGEGEDIVLEKAGMILTRLNFRKLSGHSWLYESVISLYLRLIEERSEQNTVDLPKVYALSSILTHRLMTRGYSKPRSRQVNVFSYDLVLCPVSYELHWTLVVIDNRKRLIEHLDSQNKFEGNAVQALHEYLAEEHRDIYGELLPRYHVLLRSDAPQQVGDQDCGVFVCTFAEHVSRGAPLHFSQVDIPYLRSRIAHEILSDQLL
jgi:sentrin-specific protease 1